MSKQVTLSEFVESHNRCGDSVMSMAFDALQVSDDPEFVKLAQAAVDAEDDFLKALNERGVEL